MKRALNQIVQDLRQRRYKIIDAVNVMKWKTRDPLPVFMATFYRTENINKIYIKSLMLEG